MTPVRFRQLLWLYVALTIAAIVISFLPGGYSEALGNAYESEPDTWLLRDTWRALAVVVLLLGAWIAGFIGLLLFKPWGRSLSLVTTVAGLIVGTLTGPALMSGLEDALWTSSELLWGAALAVAYFTPVAARFATNDSLEPRVVPEEAL